MKIAQIVCVYPPYKGGIGNVAKHFADNLSKLGHDVDILTPQYFRDQKSNKNLKYLKPLFKLGNAAFIPSIFFKLKKYDVVHLHYPFFGGIEPVWFSKILNNKDFKLVIHYHMDVIGLSSLARIFSIPSKIIISSLFERAEAVTCASLDYVENSNIGNIYKNNKEKFYEIPFGVDKQKFYPGKNNPSKDFEVLFVGGLDKAHYFKGLNILIDAFKEVDKEIKLNIVGDGDLRKDFQNQVKNLNLENRINFLGKLDIDEGDLPSVYRKSDLFVLPSINKGEAFGLVLLEAMASGLPVIASDLPGVRSVFKDGEHGFLAKPNDKHDLALKINKLFQDGELRNMMAKKGREYVENKYDWMKGVKKIDEIFKNIV